MIHAFNTGAIPKRDYRNFKVKEVEPFLPKADVIPESYFTDLTDIPVLYQAKQPACTAFASAGMKMVLDYQDTGKVIDYSPRYLYAISKNEDGIPHLDGTYPILPLKILQKRGLCTQENFINNTNLPREEYNSVQGITLLADEEAEDAKISSYFEITDKSFNNLKKEIYRNKVLKACIRHGGEFYTDQKGNITWNPDSLFPMKRIFPANEGHDVYFYGFDKNYIYYRNSFSERWGEKGNGWFDYTYVPAIQEVYGIVDLPNEEIRALREKRKTIQYKLIALLTQLVELLKK